MSYEQVKMFLKDADTTSAVVNDVTVLATAQTTSTFTMTPTRVDAAAAGTATGAITADATDATMAANIQVGIRALGGIYADATCVAGTTDTFIITVFGGYDVTWATTASSPTVTESGSAGGTTAVPGSVAYTGYIPVRGQYAAVKRLRLKGFVDNSLDVAITDTSAAGKTIFSATGLDTFTTNADTPITKLLTADGVAGEDGAAAANATSGVFQAPFKVVVTTSSPVTVPSGTGAAALRRPSVSLVIKNQFNQKGKAFLKRSTGALVALAGTVNLGAPYVNVKRIKLFASADTSVAPTVTDADGFVVYTKTSSDYTTAVDEQLSHEGVDQANNAVADTLDVIARSPVTISGTGLGSGTFTIDFIVEV